MLLWSVLSEIPIFYLSVFKMYVGIGKQLVGLIWTFFLETLGVGSWSLGMWCADQSSFGCWEVWEQHTINLALLTKWLGRIMGLEEELSCKGTKGLLRHVARWGGKSGFSSRGINVLAWSEMGAPSGPRILQGQTR